MDAIKKSSFISLHSARQSAFGMPDNLFEGYFNSRPSQEIPSAPAPPAFNKTCFCKSSQYMCKILQGTPFRICNFLKHARCALLGFCCNSNHRANSVAAPGGKLCSHLRASASYLLKTFAEKFVTSFISLINIHTKIFEIEKPEIHQMRRRIATERREHGVPVFAAAQADHDHAAIGCHVEIFYRRSDPALKVFLCNDARPIMKQFSKKYDFAAGIFAYPRRPPAGAESGGSSSLSVFRPAFLTAACSDHTFFNTVINSRSFAMT
jgi:hypothetical protein